MGTVMPSQAYLDYCADSTTLHESGFFAQDWHGGLHSALYMLSCFEYQERTAEDIQSMIDEIEALRDQLGENPDDMLYALTRAKGLLGA